MTASLVAGKSSRHVCGVARNDAARGKLVSEWVREGLALGERVVWIQLPDGPLHGWLDANGVDWRDATDSGALQTAHPEDVLRLHSADDIPGRIAGAQALTAEAIAEGYTGLRVGADTALALTVMPDVATQLRFEAQWEELTRVERLSLLCMYDPEVHGHDLGRGIALHPREYADDLAFAAAARDTVELGGELDVSNADLVGAFLAAADLDAGDDDVTLDLRRCEFIDVAGADRLLAFARASAPRRVRVLSPPHALRRILELTGSAHELDLVEDNR